MDAPLYDIYLTGKLAEDVSPALAAQRLAALFKSTPEAMAGLITGKAQLLKRGVDKNTAVKYRDTLQNAGCEVAFKAQATITAASEKPAAVSEKPAVPQPIPASPASPQPVAIKPDSGLQLAPAGEDLLRADERQIVAAVVVETDNLSLAPVGPLPVAAAVPTAIPDISHLSLAATGGNLVAESERAAPPAIVPDTSDLSVAEIGAPIETLKTETAPLHPDISGLQLAPVGSDVLTPEQRKHPQPPPPKTDHITLAP